jgi:hypothetical protein
VRRGGGSVALLRRNWLISRHALRTIRRFARCRFAGSLPFYFRRLRTPILWTLHAGTPPLLPRSSREGLAEHEATSAPENHPSELERAIQREKGVRTVRESPASKSGAARCQRPHGLPTRGGAFGSARPLPDPGRSRALPALGPFPRWCFGHVSACPALRRTQALHLEIVVVSRWNRQAGRGWRFGSSQCTILSGGPATEPGETRCLEPVWLARRLSC